MNKPPRPNLLVSLFLCFLAPLLIPVVQAKAASLEVERIAGSNRYETAVKVSQATFANRSRVVYIATGHGFADALAAGPVAAIFSGPILLTARDSLPQVVRDEVTRLQPERIVILGGSGAVSQAVQTELSKISGAQVVRLAGSDRYETAVEISRYFIESTSRKVILSTGSNFADALAAGPAAATLLSPILLTTPRSLPKSVVEEIERLQPEELVVLGGEGVISREVEAELVRRFRIPLIYRISGGNRFETAVELSKDTYLPVVIDEVIVTTGSNFADALAAAPRLVPIFMSNRDCIPDVVLTEIRRLSPRKVVILGGEQILSRQVATLTSCSGGSSFADEEGGSSDGSIETPIDDRARAILDPLAPMTESKGEDRTAIVLCRVPVNSKHPDYQSYGTTRVDLEGFEVTNFANRYAMPYFKQISNNRYWPTFQYHLSLDLSVTEGMNDCRQHAISMTKHSYTNVVAFDNSPYTGGFSGPGYIDGRHLDVSPSISQRGAYIGGGALNPVYPSLGVFVLLHELGHTLHWPHSHLSINHEYDNPLDIMSSGYSCSTRQISTTPCQMLNTLAFNRFLSGWIDSDQVSIHESGTTVTTLSTSSKGGRQLLVALNPNVPGSFLTFEARVNGSTEVGLPHNGVAIHAIDQSARQCENTHQAICPSLWRTQGQALGTPGTFDHLIKPGTSTFTISGLTITVTDDVNGFRVEIKGSYTR